MIDIKLSQDPAEFRPGETILGSIDWSNLQPKTSRIQVRLVWSTTGKGDTDYQIVSTHTTEAPASSGTAPFRFLVPTRPFSFSGKLISLNWSLEANVNSDRDIARHPLTISNDGKEILLQNSFDRPLMNKVGFKVKPAK